MSGLVQVALDAVNHYGWVALFVVMALEMGMILHFLPTELVLVAATSQLATTPTRLALVVMVATAGSLLGSYLPWAAGRYGGRTFLARHPRFFHMPPERVARFERWMQHPVGASMVLVLRIVPGVRTLPSIPAGIARMRPWVYGTLTGAGVLVFNFLLAYATYGSLHPGLPFAQALQDGRVEASAELGRLVTYWAQRWWLGVPLLVALVGWAFWIWRQRRAIHPRAGHFAVNTLRNVAIALAVVGAGLLVWALVAPRSAFGVISWFAVDYADWGTTSGWAPAILALLAAGVLSSIAVLALALVYPLRRLATWWHNR